MAFTYDPTTPAGLVRLLAVDADQANARYSDDEITAFLTLNGSDVRLAAAQALDTSASEAALVRGVTRFDGMLLNGQAVAEALSAQAAELRRQSHEADDGSATSLISVAEMVLDQFSYREKLVNEMLRLNA